jgi:hypothetical protein
MSRSTCFKKRELNPKFERRDGFNLIFHFFKQSHTECKQEGCTENKQCCIEESQFQKYKNKFLKKCWFEEKCLFKGQAFVLLKNWSNKMFLEFRDEANAIV